MRRKEEEGGTGSFWTTRERNGDRRISNSNTNCQSCKMRSCKNGEKGVGYAKSFCKNGKYGKRNVDTVATSQPAETFSLNLLQFVEKSTLEITFPTILS